MSPLSIPVHSREEREQQLLELYKTTFPMVARFISKRGGTFEQSKDVFHDALVVWYERNNQPNPIATNASAYLFGIAKHLWYRKFAEANQNIPLQTDFQEMTEEEPSSSRLLNLLETAGKKCLDLLRSFYYDKLSIAELASGYGFSSVRSATVQKYKCLEKVRETVKQKSMCYEDFFE